MPESTTLSRRSFLKGAVATAAAISAGSLLAACGSQETAPSTSASSESEPEPEPSSSSSSVESTEEAVSSSSAASPAGPVLVAWFSATGNTERVAQIIADHLDAESFAITPVQPYTAEDLDYNDGESRTGVERNDPNRSVELEEVTPAGFDDFQTVFVGYPIWWGDASWVVDGFVSGNDFTGKTVVPFCTSGSSPIGASGQNLASMAGRATGSKASVSPAASRRKKSRRGSTDSACSSTAPDERKPQARGRRPGVWFCGGQARREELPPPG